MFHVNSNKQLIQIANSIGQGAHQFSEDDEVWRGDDGSFVIGDAAEFDEDEATMYVQAGTLSEYVTKDR
jgi:hypothetical protein